MLDEEAIRHAIDREAIREVIAIWCQAVDDGCFEVLEDLLDPNVQIIGRGITLKGRAAVLDSIREARAEGETRGLCWRHIAVNTVIHLDKSSAVAVSDFYLPAWDGPNVGWSIDASGRYEDRLLKTDRWRFSERSMPVWKDSHLPRVYRPETIDRK